MLIGPRRALLGSSSFTPASVGGLKLWLRPDRETFQTSAFATPALATSDPLGGWRDQSGTGNHVSNATSTKRLTLQSNIAGGFPGMLGDAVDDNLNTVAATGITAGGSQFTLFVVLKTPSAFGTQAFVNIGASGGGTGGRTFRTTAGGALEFLKANVASLGTSSTTLSTSTVYVVAFDYNSPNGTFYVNGTAGGTISSAQTFSSPAGEIFIGCQDDAGVTPFGGHVIEVAYYDTQISAGNIAAVSNYERARYRF